jgi:transposase
MTFQQNPAKKGKSNSWQKAARSKMAADTDLMTLTVLQLRRCATKRHISGRSKLKYKRELVNELLGMLTYEEFANIKRIVLPPTTITPPSKVDDRIAKSKKTGGKKKKTKKKKIKMKRTQPKITPVSPKRLGIGNGTRFQGHIMGVDVHSEELAYCIVDEAFILKEGMLPNSPFGRNELIALCCVYDVQSVAMESTADYWRSLYWELTAHKIASLVANATQTKNTQGKKTDKFDAQRIAVAHRDGRLKPSVCCTINEFALRKALRHAEKEIQLSTKYLNRIRAIQRMCDATKWVKNLHTSQYGKHLLVSLAGCNSIADLEAEIEQVPKVWADEIRHNHTKELWDFYQKLKAYSRWNEFIREFSSYLHHQRQAEMLYLVAVQYADENPRYRESLELLLTIPGIGFKSAAMIMSEIINVDYFENPKALVRWAGLNPKVSQSGLKKNITGKISKKGNKYLRKTLFVAAQNEYAHGHQTGHPLGAKMRLMKDHAKKSYKTAVTAGARKQLVWIWHMLTNNTQFQVDAPVEVIEKLQKSAERKIKGLTRRIKNITRHVQAAAKSTINAIQSYEEVDTTLEFAKVVLRARNGEGSSIQFLPYETLVGLSQAFLKIGEG